MRTKMAIMIDPEDDDLILCPLKATTNGILLLEDIIQQYITRKAQEKKMKKSQWSTLMEELLMDFYIDNEVIPVNGIVHFDVFIK